MIHWVFLDVGNILLDEDPLGYENFRIHWDAVRQVAPHVSFQDLLAIREERATAGSRWPLYEAVSLYLNDAQCSAAWARADHAIRRRYSLLSPPIAGAWETVGRLWGRYHLGVIANQGTECRPCLEEGGLLEAFEVVALSEEINAFKPDPSLFQAALEMAKALPEHCLMVGDRLDNDIEPANRLGMKTAWIRWPMRSAKGWNPSDPEACAWRDSLDRIAAIQAGLHQYISPTVTLDTVGELAAYLVSV